MLWIYIISLKLLNLEKANEKLCIYNIRTPNPFRKVSKFLQFPWFKKITI